ncbi:DNA-3-methyladenine glycosylase I [Glaciecola sp. 1036]|uniref:DNA-3-methyladenine glycosylase I n=1 Tax=Alteromonadaceae TaxID=72275 RepID=UPI003D06E45D
MEPFAQIKARAVKRKGSQKMLDSLCATPLTNKQILAISDDRFLAEFTKKVFQSGFVWRVVRQKWPDFEEVFFGFDIQKILLMPDEMLEKKATDPKIIRNLNKVRTIHDNALMIQDTSRESGSFAQFIVNWDKQDLIGLWDYLREHGARLGGNTGPYALRALGIDTFLLSQDVEAYFRHHDLISGSLRSKRSLQTIQSVFNHWHQDTGLSYTQLSQILSFSVGDNFVGMSTSAP